MGYTVVEAAPDAGPLASIEQLKKLSEEHKQKHCVVFIFRPQYWPLLSFHYFLNDALGRLCIQSGVKPPVIKALYQADNVCDESHSVIVECADEASCVRLIAVRYIPIGEQWANCAPEAIGGNREAFLTTLNQYVPHTNYLGQSLIMALPYLSYGSGNGQMYEAWNNRTLEQPGGHSVCFPLSSVHHHYQKQQVRLRRDAGILCGQFKDLSININALWMNRLDPGYRVYKYDLGDGCVWHKFTRYLSSKDEYQKYRLVLTLDNKPTNWDQGSLFRYLRDYFYRKFLRDGIPPPVITDVSCYENARTANVCFRDEYSIAIVLASPHVDTSMATNYQQPGYHLGALMTFRLHVPGAYREVQRQVKLRAAQGIDTTTTEAHGTANEPFPPWSNGIQLFQREFYGGITSPTGVMDGTEVRVFTTETNDSIIGGMNESVYSYSRKEPLFWPPSMKLVDAPFSLKSSLCVVLKKVPLAWTDNHVWSHLQRLSLLERELGFIVPTILGVSIREDPLHKNDAVVICADEPSRNRLLGLRVLYTHPEPSMATPNALLAKYQLQVERGDIDRAESMKHDLEQVPDFLMLAPYSLETVVAVDDDALTGYTNAEKAALADEDEDDDDSSSAVVSVDSLNTLQGGPSASLELFEQPFRWQECSQSIKLERADINTYHANMSHSLKNLIDSHWIMKHCLKSSPDLKELMEQGDLPFFIVDQLDDEHISKLPDGLKDTFDTLYSKLQARAKQTNMPVEILLKKLDWRRQWPAEISLDSVQSKLAFHTKKLTPLDESQYPALLHNYTTTLDEQSSTWAGRCTLMVRMVSHIIDHPDVSWEEVCKVHFTSEVESMQYPSVTETRDDLMESLVFAKNIVELRERCTILIRQRPTYWSEDDLKLYIQHYMKQLALPVPDILYISSPTDSSAVVVLSNEGDADRLVGLKQISLPLKTSQFNVSSSLKPFMIVGRWLEPNPNAFLRKLLHIASTQVELNPVPFPTTAIVGKEEDFNSLYIDWWHTIMNHNANRDETSKKTVVEVILQNMQETRKVSIATPWSCPEIPKAVKRPTPADGSARLNAIIGASDGSATGPVDVTSTHIQQQQVPDSTQQSAEQQMLEQQRQWQYFLSTPQGQLWQYQQQAAAMGYQPQIQAQQPPPVSEVASAEPRNRETVVNGLISNITQNAASASEISVTNTALPEATETDDGNVRSLRPGVGMRPKNGFFGQQNVHSSMQAGYKDSNAGVDAKGWSKRDRE